MAILKLLATVCVSCALANVNVRRYELFEGSLESSEVRALKDAFQVAVNVSIEGPSSSRHPSMVVAAFYDGPGVWRFRFTPDALGDWTWRSVSADDTSMDGKVGRVSCVDGPSHGGIIIDEENPHHLIYEDGSRHLLVGYEVDWLWALGLEPDTSDGPSVDEFVGEAAKLGFNHFVLNVFTNFSGWNEWLPDRAAPKVAPTFNTPWHGDDRAQLNLHFFQHYDKVLSTLDKHGSVAHVMFYVGNKNVAWAPENSTEDEMYWRYCMARFAAFPNVVLDVSKEASHYGVGVGFIADRLRLMRALNAHGRVVTAHAGQWGESDCPEADACDMISRQSHFEDPVDFYNDTITTRDRNPKAPMFNIESVYEAGPVRGCAGAPNFTYALCGGAEETCFATGGTPDNLCMPFSELRMTMWDLYMAGGYGAWYFCDTAWDVITTAAPSPGQMDVGRLVDFFKESSWWRLEPRDDLLRNVGADMQTVVHCLAKDGEEYIIYGHSQASFDLNLSAATTSLEGTWYSPSTGSSAPLESDVSLGGIVTLTPPETLAGPDVALRLWSKQVSISV